MSGPGWADEAGAGGAKRPTRAAAATAGHEGRGDGARVREDRRESGEAWKVLSVDGSGLDRPDVTRELHRCHSPREEDHQNSPGPALSTRLASQAAGAPRNPLVASQGRLRPLSPLPSTSARNLASAQAEKRGLHYAENPCSRTVRGGRGVGGWGFSLSAPLPFPARSARRTFRRTAEPSSPGLSPPSTPNNGGRQVPDDAAAATASPLPDLAVVEHFDASGTAHRAVITEGAGGAGHRFEHRVEIGAFQVEDVDPRCGTTGAPLRSRSLPSAHDRTVPASSTT